MKEGFPGGIEGSEDVGIGERESESESLLRPDTTSKAATRGK